ncbi:YicC family protein [Halobacillus litoralis]|uniref:YicC/YloC family endoribonuclease n=1 Tax=Halobacillus litoralis TaxID=45668 RepID=UPI001CD2A0B1|nr:YicC/YloC family endoribonuclease [Halobacillus litoralis]MCA0969259.1 YicC family protein [Halobacillus litoralis]
MVRSMTGYGKETVHVGDTQIDVEVRSVNHRFLDISTKAPRHLLFMEEKMKRAVKDKLSRGRVELFVTIEGEGLFDKKVDVDDQLVSQYIEKLQDIKDRYQLTGDVSIDMVSKLDDIFTVREIEGSTDELQQSLIEAVERALDRLLSMRVEEGLRLRDDFEKRLDTIKTILAKLEEKRPGIVEEYREKIRERIEEYAGETLDPDQSRVLQEVGLLAEKGDVTEELTRLDAHVEQFLTTLDKKEAIGRKLDFVVQEMHREVNTIGSKSNDAEVSEWVVALKSEIEKVKEQVQNVE